MLQNTALNLSPSPWSGSGLGGPAAEETAPSLRPLHRRQRGRQQLWRGVHHRSPHAHASPGASHAHPQGPGQLQRLWLRLWPLLVAVVDEEAGFSKKVSASGRRVGLFCTKVTYIEGFCGGFYLVGPGVATDRLDRLSATILWMNVDPLMWLSVDVACTVGKNKMNADGATAVWADARLRPVKRKGWWEMKFYYIKQNENDDCFQRKERIRHSCTKLVSNF